MSLTPAEKQELLNAIRSESTSIDELPVASSLDNINSLPAVREDQVVSVPVSLLAEPAVTAAQAANAAAANAESKAAAAQTAADNANSKATAANTAAAAANTAAAEAQTVIDEYEDTAIAARNGATARFEAILENATVLQLSTTAPGRVVYAKNLKVFGLQTNTASNQIYNNWPTADLYMDDTSSAILKDKTYLLDEQLYVWSEEKQDLVEINAESTSSEIKVVKYGAEYFTVGKILFTNGAISGYNQGKATEPYLEIPEDCPYMQWLSPQTNAFATVCLYDSDKVFIEHLYQRSVGFVDISKKQPSAKYVRICCGKDWNEAYVSFSNKIDTALDSMTMTVIDNSRQITTDSFIINGMTIMQDGRQMSNDSTRSITEAVPIRTPGRGILEFDGLTNHTNTSAGIVLFDEVGSVCGNKSVQGSINLSEYPTATSYVACKSNDSVVDSYVKETTKGIIGDISQLKTDNKTSIVAAINEIATNNKLYGKKWASFGDSWTLNWVVCYGEQGSYSQRISSRAKMNVINPAVGGAKIIGEATSNSSVLYQVLNTNVADCDYATIMVGTNDCRVSSAIWDGSSHDSNDFIYCYSQAIDHLINANPLIRIGIIIPTKCATGQYYDQMHAATMQVIQKYGLVYCDLNNYGLDGIMCNWKTNYSDALLAARFAALGYEPYERMHFNTNGMEIITTAVLDMFGKL